MSYRPFFNYPQTRIRRFIFIISWFCWVVGMGLMGFQMYNHIAWGFNFPTYSGLRHSSWCILFSIQIFSMWMPFSNLLAYWNLKKLWIHIVYVGGCILAIILDIASILLLHRYKDSGEVRKEYIEATVAHIEAYSKIPGWLESEDILSSQKCCGWFSPLDIGTLFPLTVNLKGNKKYLKQVAKCFGNVFRLVPNKKDPQDFEFIVDVTGAKPNYAVGCGEIYKVKAREICYFIVYVALLISLFAIVFIVAYTFFVRFPSCFEKARDVEMATKKMDTTVLDTKQTSATAVGTEGQQVLRIVKSPASPATEIDDRVTPVQSEISTFQNYAYDRVEEAADPEPQKTKKSKKKKHKKREKNEND